MSAYEHLELATIGKEHYLIQRLGENEKGEPVAVTRKRIEDFEVGTYIVWRYKKWYWLNKGYMTPAEDE